MTLVAPSSSPIPSPRVPFRVPSSARLAGFPLVACLVLVLSPTTVSAAPLSQGIELEGLWKISVLEPDGTLVEEKVFHNALVNPAALTGLLDHGAVSGGVYVLLTDQTAVSTGIGPCDPDCEIVVSGMSIGLTPESTNLVASQVGTNFETLRLSGSVTVSNNATIDLVNTWILLCNGATNTAAQCRAAPDSASVLTSKVLSSAVSVTSGQIVQVTVDLTFS